MMTAIARNLNLNLDFKLHDVGLGASLDVNKIIEDYQSDGSVIIDQKRIFFYKHISESLQFELYRIRKPKGKLEYNFRIVIFIDDLDRCTPERALEILESIKTFFDIEGIIYVIGMDPLTIDPIIKTKYGENSKIDGLNYLQKIVQLPFQIPVWSSLDLSNMIGNLVKKAGLSESYSDEILKNTNQELIIKATQLNPRDVKRFINSIVLAKDVYGQDIEDIDKIIAIQAFYFHGRNWIKFLKLIIPYEQRIRFFIHFILLLDTKLNNIDILDDLKMIIKDDSYKEKEDKYLDKFLIRSYREDKLLNSIYNTLIEIDDNDLFVFLKIASVPLLKIDRIDKYLRIVDSTGITNKKNDITEIDSKQQLEYLKKDKVTEFNNYQEKYRNILIHLPYADLHKRKLREIFLFNAILFKANLSESDLTWCYLTNADLSEAKLTNTILQWASLNNAKLFNANLDNADLTNARLSDADFSDATLSNAKLSRTNMLKTKFCNSNLTGANLFDADLTRTDLSNADLSDANISKSNLIKTKLFNTKLNRVNLSEAKLFNIDLSSVKLKGANLTNSIIINITFSRETSVSQFTNFEDAIIDNPQFIDYLNENKCEKVPKKIINKQELRSRLENKEIDQIHISNILDYSNLPSI